MDIIYNITMFILWIITGIIITHLLCRWFGNSFKEVLQEAKETVPNVQWVIWLLVLFWPIIIVATLINFLFIEPIKKFINWLDKIF